MAKTLTIEIGDLSVALTPTKVDRDKLYGYTELRVMTDDGSACCQAAINGDGVNIVCPGATKIGITDENGNWVERQSLVPLTEDGSEPVWIPSSFDNAIKLTREATSEELLDLTIQSIYQLCGDDINLLSDNLKDRIFAFDFSYRGGYECNEAFMIATEAGVFILTGSSVEYEYLGLEEAVELDEPDEDFSFDDGDLDFSMM